MKRLAAMLGGLLVAVAIPALANADPRGGPPVGPDSLGADWGQQQDEARQGVRQGLRPMRQVIAEIARRTPGHLLDAGTERMGDRPVYRVRWQTNDGRRIDYIVDAISGAILSGG